MVERGVTAGAPILVLIPHGPHTHPGHLPDTGLQSTPCMLTAQEPVQARAAAWQVLARRCMADAHDLAELAQPKQAARSMRQHGSVQPPLGMWTAWLGGQQREGVEVWADELGDADRALMANMESTAATTTTTRDGWQGSGVERGADGGAADGCDRACMRGVMSQLTLLVEEGLACI